MPATLDCVGFLVSEFIVVHAVIHFISVLVKQSITQTCIMLSCSFVLYQCLLFC